jgi:hypothetical protein
VKQHGKFRRSNPALRTPRHPPGMMPLWRQARNSGYASVNEAEN